MKQNKKRALFYVLLFVLGVVFGLTKINGQAEDGYLLKADEKGNDDLIYDYPLEKDQGVSEEYLVGRSTLEGFRLSVGRNQKDIRFDVKIEEKGGGITREWKDLTEQDLDDRGRICLFLDEKERDAKGKVFLVRITARTAGLNIRMYPQPDGNLGASDVDGMALDLQLIYDRVSVLLVNLLFILGCAVGNLLLFLLLNREKVSMVKAFLLLYGTLGAVYLGVIPFSMVPDESIHYFRAYEIADGNFISDITDEEGHAAYLISYPWEWEETKDHLITQYEVKEQTGLVESEENDAGHSFNATALYSPLSYLPQSLGIAAARLFTGKVWILFLAGRIFNFAAIGAVMALAVHLMPYGKKYLILIALIPMNLHECISLAPDGMVTALVFLLIAFVLYLRERGKEPLTRGQLAALYVLAVAISLYKIVYLPFCLLYFLIPREQFGSKKRYFGHVAGVMAAVAVFLGGWMRISSRYLFPFNPGVDSGQQTHEILTHPFFYAGVVINTLVEKATYYFNTMLGTKLGWLNVEVDEILLYLFAFVVVAAIAADAARKKRTDRPFAWVTVLILASTVLLILTSLYVEWTAVRAQVVEGVQGRYFIPLLLPLCLAIAGRREDENELWENDRLGLTLALGVNICVLAVLIITFLP